MKIMFSVHVGDSVAHVLRIRGIASYLASCGHQVLVSSSSKGMPYLNGWLPSESVVCNDQRYSLGFAPQTKSLKSRFKEHALNEAVVYSRFRPDLIIGDTGLVSTAYVTSTPSIRILNRFYLEIAENFSSPFSPSEKARIRSDFEALVNNARIELGNRRIFDYSAFIQPPVILNGETVFVDDLPSIYVRSGVYSELPFMRSRTPDRSVCFCTLGTGFSETRRPLLQRLVEVLGQVFRHVYVACGVSFDPESIELPSNVTAKRRFNQLPPDVGFVVCQGGYGVIHIALSHGLPLVCVPLHIEHYSNSWHVERNGFGINTGFFDRANFRGLYQKIEIDWDQLQYSVRHDYSDRRVCPFPEPKSSDTLALAVNREIERLGHA